MCMYNEHMDKIEGKTTFRMYLRRENFDFSGSNREKSKAKLG